MLLRVTIHLLVFNYREYQDYTRVPRRVKHIRCHRLSESWTILSSETCCSTKVCSKGQVFSPCTCVYEHSDLG